MDTTINPIIDEPINEETPSNQDISSKFSKVFNEFVSDLLLSFPDFSPFIENLNEKECYDFCSKEYPKHFFLILYENEELIKTNMNVLPGLSLSILMNHKNTNDTNKKTIWKYLQLLLFSCVENLDTNTMFGDANNLFSAISQDDLQEKLKSTIEGMKDLFNDGFSNENVSEGEPTNNNTSSEPFLNENDLHSHLNKLMEGKIGSLAKEIATETQNEFSNEKDQETFLSDCMKNPEKLMNMVKNIGTKLDEKINKGDLNKNDLFEEATNIMNNMKDMPGIKETMSKMGFNPKNFNMAGMQEKMKETMKTSQMKDRLNKVREKREKERQTTMSQMNIEKKDQETIAISFKDETDVKKTSKPKNKKKKRNQ